MNPTAERLTKVIRSCETMDQLIVAGAFFQLSLKRLTDLEQAQAWVILKDQHAILRRKGFKIVGAA